MSYTDIYEKMDWFRPEALESTRKLLEEYYTDKITIWELRFMIELVLKHVKDEPAFPVLELTFGKQWHPEHIGKHLGCKEKKVPKLLDEMVKRATVAVWGVDAFDLLSE